jgi:ASC-1-like (ASCH) protein
MHSLRQLLAHAIIFTTVYMLRSLFGNNLLPKMKGGLMGGHGTSQIIIVLLFIIVVVAAICWIYLKKKSETHSYRCGGAEGGFDEYDSDEYESGEYDGGASEDAEVTGGADGARLGIREPWFKMMLEGKKKVEGRLRRGAAATLEKGDLITVARSRAQDDTTEYGKPYRYVTKVTRVTKYKSFADLVKAEGVEKLFPGKKKDSEALEIYRQHSSEADEAEVVKMHADEHGVIAIEVAPYDEKAQAEYGNIRPARTPRGTPRGAPRGAPGGNRMPSARATRRNFY